MEIKKVSAVLFMVMVFTLANVKVVIEMAWESTFSEMGRII